MGSNVRLCLGHHVHRHLLELETSEPGFGSNYHGLLLVGTTDSYGYASGQMGDSLPYASLGTGVHAVDLSGGGWHFCALLNTTQVKYV
jgi:hypothetical protein